MCGSGSEYKYELYTQLQSDALNYKAMHSIAKRCILASYVGRRGVAVSMGMYEYEYEYELCTQLQSDAFN